jgi:hypothetical protein
MLWPFRPKRPDCDVRAFRDPNSGRLTLRLQGDVGLPLKWEQPILTLEVKLDALSTRQLLSNSRINSCSYSVIEVLPKRPEVTFIMEVLRVVRCAFGTAPQTEYFEGNWRN